MHLPPDPAPPPDSAVPDAVGISRFRALAITPIALVLLLIATRLSAPPPIVATIIDGLTILALLAHALFFVEPAVRRIRRESARRAAEHRQAQRARELLETTGRIAQIGSWLLSGDGQSLAWSTQVRRIHEVDDDYRPRVDQAIDFYAPEARPIIRQAVERGLRDAQPFDLELRLITARGNERWVRALGFPVQSGGRVTELWGAFQDITEQTRARRELEASQNRFQRASEAATNGLWEFDPRTGSAWFSPELLDLLQRDPASPAPPTRNDFRERVHPHDRAALEQCLAAHLASNAPCYAELRLEVAPALHRWFRLRGRAARDERGIPLRLSGSVSDIHDRHTMQSRLDLATRAAGIGLWDWDLPSGQAYFSDTFYTMLGYEPRELPMKLETWRTLTHPSEQAAVHRDIQRHIQGRTPIYQNERRLRRKDGSWAWIRDIGEIIERDAHGAPKRMIGVLVDIDAVKRLGVALERIIEQPAALGLTESMEHLSRAVAEVFGVMYAAVARCVTDEQGRELAQVVGGWHDGGPAERVLYSLEGTPCDHALRDGYFFRSARIVDAFPEDTPLRDMGAESYAAIAICNSRGERIGLLVVLHRATFRTSLDIESTLRLFGARAAAEIERAESEAALRDAIDRANAANRAKTEFLANMSHEIRTPMTAILGYADLVADPDSHALDVASHADTIRRNANHLMTIINDILDMSKIEAGRLGIDLIETDPARILDEVASLMQPRAADKGLSFIVRRDSELPSRVISDETRLRQILLNLAGNAVKFTASGSVTLCASHDPVAERLRIRVIDTGIGMSDEQRLAIARFDAFSQADSSTTRRFGGTGLGLRICNSLATMLGGKISIESEPGRGSTFTLDIPAAIAPLSPESTAADRSPLPAPSPEPAALPANEDRPLAGVRILLAEDGPDNQRLIRYFLEHSGAEVSIVHNGLEAIDAIKSGSFTPDLVLMDMQMPELDGYSCTRRLRDDGITLPVIALTAHAMAGDREKCLAAGCDDYLSKPIDRAALTAACLYWAPPIRHARFKPQGSADAA
ncbi:MAG: PAS domain-containing protein [Phycisphaerales bacterium JB037]